MKNKTFDSVNVNAFNLNEKVIITTTKVASTWAFNNFKKEHNVNLSNRDVLNFTTMGYSFLGEAIHGDSKFIDSESLVESQLRSNILKRYNEISSGNTTDKIYILYRNPIDRYIQALQEDIKNYLSKIVTTFGHQPLLEFYISFIEDTPNKQEYINFLKYNFKNDRYDLLDISLSNKDLSKYRDLFKSITKGILLWFFKPSVTNHNNLDNTILTEFDITNANNVFPRYGNISNHYLPYLTQLWYIYNNLNKPDWVEFIDIDKTDINSLILNYEKSTNMDNITPKFFKNIWVHSFWNIVNTNDKINNDIHNILSSDMVIYNWITKHYS
jgi:hypothetical protein